MYASSCKINNIILSYYLFNSTRCGITDLLTFEESHNVVFWDLSIESVKLVKQEFHDVTAILVVDSTHNLLYEVQCLAPNKHIAE